MHAHYIAAAVAAATLATSTLIWAPGAFANAPEPQPGTVEILKKDPDGALLAGAEFSLLDTLNGTKALTGTTKADGVLRFENVTPGVWRLKETATGSLIHDLAPDQDVIVTPGQNAKLTIVDTFKPADLTVTKTDKTTGKPLAGAVINITAVGDTKPIILTTGKDGTATTKLPVTTRAGTTYTATETKAPDGYQLNSAPVKITAKPGTPATAAFTNTKKEKPTQPPTTPKPSATPTTPTTPPSTPPAKPSPSTTEAPSQPPVSEKPTPEESTSSTSSPAPNGSLAQTGAGSTGWLLAGAGALIAAGGAAVFALRRRRNEA
ncbi:collagen binding domain-containing protein [Streptomyces sp. NPDC097617]|uniref:MSCRAMM family protein n=1 Tax=Streptomyces sp. NPDC097617 TaxID=3366091 RepID=UPI0038072ABF